VILVTGYEPFGEFDGNPSARVAERLDGETVAGHNVVGEVLPVEFDAVRPRLADLLDAHAPDAVVATGLAAGRSAVAVERVGINVDDAVTTPDNADADPVGDPIDPEGPDAHFATLPVAEVAEACLDRGVPTRVSNSAGTHCCNHALYAARDLIEERRLDAPAGFVHLPLTPAGTIRQAEAPSRGGGVQPSLPLSLQVEAVRTAAEVSAESGVTRDPA
jgi:pyroglutamyl-peptidase